MQSQTRYIIIVLLLGFLKSTPLNAQQKKLGEILERAGKYYTEQPQFKVDMTFTMYRGFSGENVSESYTGTMQKNGDFIKNTVLNTQVYQFSKAKIILDEDMKTLTYIPIDSEQEQQAPVDLSAFLEYYQQSQVVGTEKEWICEMVSENTDFNEVPYGKVILYVSKEDYRITKQELYFSNRIPFESKNGSGIEQDYGRLVIDLTHYKDAQMPVSTLSDFVITSNPKKLELQGAYSSYQLIDQTKQ